MTDETSNEPVVAPPVNGGCFYQEYRPSRRERFWRAMGYRFHLGEEHGPEMPAPLGRMQNKNRFHFGWLDRLRLLLTGELEVTLTFDMDVPSPDKIRTQLDWQIKAPGEKH